MKKIVKAAALVICTAFVLAGCSKNAKKDYILATGGTGGTYYPFGGAIANIWNTKIENMNVTAQATGASAENLRLINKGEAEYAIVQNDVMDYAYNGKDLFAGEKLENIMTIGTLYPEVVQIAVSKDSGIKSVADFRGKRISVGDAGSGVEFNAKQILEGYGLTFDDIKKSNLSFKESAEGIQNGTLDGCFVTAGVPNAALQELAFSAGLVLVPVDSVAAEKICKKYNYYTVTSIPGGTYKGTDSDTAALAIKATLAVNAKLDEEIVYQMTKALFENLDSLAAAHAKGKEVSAKAAVTGVSVPFHPGAKKYFTEIGLK
ncbi:MAG: TAXI family TRAP transporter solute-binding subunit [Treponema sp.]|nr:TAXI family TRAP transporter solute-binding subunit [Treponema sp.]MDD7449525.1 TAXI family TRAP transporter solute-binding subunit [Treponema sp.]MDY2924862.1 TAXI family TRAP transporter solute-binding subunit [Treponema sp.]MDY5684426.1 TAXI family TRAP transporter solute-binding subunit [Treponema sp.]